MMLLKIVVPLSTSGFPDPPILGLESHGLSGLSGLSLACQAVKLAGITSGNIDLRACRWHAEWIYIVHGLATAVWARHLLLTDMFFIGNYVHHLSPICLQALFHSTVSVSWVFQHIRDIRDIQAVQAPNISCYGKSPSGASAPAAFLPSPRWRSSHGPHIVVAGHWP